MSTIVKLATALSLVLLAATTQAAIVKYEFSSTLSQNGDDEDRFALNGAQIVTELLFDTDGVPTDIGTTRDGGISANYRALSARSTLSRRPRGASDLSYSFDASMTVENEPVRSAEQDAFAIAQDGAARTGIGDLETVVWFALFEDGDFFSSDRETPRPPIFSPDDLQASDVGTLFATDGLGLVGFLAYDTIGDSIAVSVVPIPAGLILLPSGLIALAAWARRARAGSRPG